VGHIRKDLFLEIADDARDQLEALAKLTTIANTSRFDGIGALENLKGQLKLFELLMRRAAGFCAWHAIDGTRGNPAGGLVSVSLDLVLSDLNLVHPEGERRAVETVMKKIPATVQTTRYDTASDGLPDPRIAELLEDLNSTILACRPVTDARGPARASQTLAAAPGKSGKRRGRPPKSLAIAAPAKHRGRPRKIVDIDAAPAMPKRRGRPPKAVSAAADAPKKRGRPRKVVAAAATTRARADTKKRGRPRKA
jgi:AT hook motif